jgi:hypothetical protein
MLFMDLASALERTVRHGIEPTATRQDSEKQRVSGGERENS